MEKNPIFGLSPSGYFELYPAAWSESEIEAVQRTELRALTTSLRSGINTDEIYPVPACVYSQRIGRFALSGDRLQQIKIGDLEAKRPSVLIGGENFGSGSAREQAALSLQEVGVELVIAPSFNQTFRDNCLYNGLLTSTDLDLVWSILESGGNLPRQQILESFSGIEKEILEAGGLFAYNRDRLEGKTVPPPPETSERPQTLVEKIISQHLSLSRPTFVKPGDQVFVPVDLRFSYEVFTGLIENLWRQKELAPWPINDPSSVLLFTDHFILSDHPEVANLIQAQEQFARHQNLSLSHAQKEDGGICHQVLIEKHLLPGQIVIGTDSHTGTGGVLDALCLPVGATALANALITKDVLITVPATIRLNFVGQLKSGCSAKDVMLFLLSQKWVKDGASLGKVLEYGGQGLDHLPVDELAVLTNMATETGALTAVLEPNQKIIDYLIHERGVSPGQIEKHLVKSDAAASYSQVIEICLDDIEPMLALPGSPQNSLPLSSLKEKIRIQKAFLGSCTGGRLTDLRQAAALLKNQKIEEGIELVVQPASMNIYHQAEQDGLLAIFQKAGAKVILPACGACVGQGPGGPQKGEVGISSSNRNYPGRMGEGEVYLASPLVVTQSAITGFISSF